MFDGYMRKQYMDKASDRNPFGTDENPSSFESFDVFTKVRAHYPSMYVLDSQLKCGRSAFSSN